MTPVAGPARPALRLLAGILLFDLLINAPRFSPADPVLPLLPPSLDLLIALALLLGVSHAAPRSRAWLAMAVSLIIAAVIAGEAVERLGPGSAGRLAAGIGAFFAGAAAAFFISRLVLNAFAAPLVRSLFLAAAALCTVIQVLTGLRVFSPSAIPGIIRRIVAGGA